MPLSPEEIYKKVVEQVGPDGRLPMPPVAEWDTFPWEQVGDTWLPKVVQLSNFSLSRAVRNSG